MNRIQYVRKVIAGQSVLIAVPTSRDISTSSGPDHPPDQELRKTVQADVRSGAGTVLFRHYDLYLHPEKCGQEVAGVLKRLRVDSGQNVFARPTASPPPLQYRDVFVLTRSSELREEKTDKDTGQVTSPASEVVRGLRKAGVPVRVVGWMKEDGVARWEEGVREMAVPAEDRVTVATFAVTHGLERKVVVYLPGRWGVTDEGRSADYIEAEDRVYLASRCTTQLVMLENALDIPGA
nr:hypothetical protein BaRGS_034574 [Batillaria attramentaria]